MPYKEVWVDDAELIDFDDRELIDELEGRGWEVQKAKVPSDISDIEPDIDLVIWRYKMGYIEDAMLLLERMYPELYGLSKRIKE